MLGSLPGAASLAVGKYYAHPRNSFWHLVGHALGEDLAALDYSARLGRLTSRGLGLWDTIASARRSGSLDSAIRDAQKAPLHSLIATLPHLRAVACNGAKAFTLAAPQLADSGLAILRLPSSSPAYAAMPLREKEMQWSRLRDYLETPRVSAH